MLEEEEGTVPTSWPAGFGNLENLGLTLVMIKDFKFTSYGFLGESCVSHSLICGLHSLERDVEMETRRCCRGAVFTRCQYCLLREGAKPSHRFGAGSVWGGGNVKYRVIHLCI